MVWDENKQRQKHVKIMLFLIRSVKSSRNFKSLGCV